jgi:hypothetical protein
MKVQRMFKMRHVQCKTTLKRLYQLHEVMATVRFPLGHSTCAKFANETIKIIIKLAVYLSKLMQCAVLFNSLSFIGILTMNLTECCS